MRVAGFTGHQYENLLIPQYLQRKPTRATHDAGLFFIAISNVHQALRTHFYSLAHNIFFGFSLQAVCQLGIFNLPVGLA